MEPLSANESVGTTGVLIDRAIAKVAEQEFRRLRKGLSNKEVVRNVCRALEEVAKTKNCRTPNYDCEWVALFYLTWFQARQINLVYSLLDQMRTELPRDLRVVDLGCGTLGVQFALAAFAATRDQAGTRISLTGLDTSRPMIAIGVEFWDCFRDIVRKEAHRSPLDRVTTTMPTIMATDPAIGFTVSRAFWPEWDRGPVTDHTFWLTSIHSAYHLQQDLLREITDWLKPRGILLTAHKCRAPDLDRVVEEMSYQFGGMKVQPRIEGCLRQTTKWRHQLCRRLRLRHPLLKSAVEWNGNPIDKDDVRIAGTFQ